MPDELMEGPEGGAADQEVTQNQDGAETPSVTEETPRQYLEVEDPSTVWTKVKVDGQEIEVPLKEALDGYSRTSDYTTKTQALAQQRQQLERAAAIQEALDRDPQLTLQWLARQHGLDLVQPQQQAPTPPPEFDDPLERQVWETNQRLAAFEQQREQERADAQVAQAVQGLQQIGASEEDVRAVVMTAMQGQFGVEAFPTIYKSIMFDRIQAQLQARRQADATTAAEAQRRQQAAQAAGQVISTGGGAAASGLGAKPGSTDGFQSVREAALAAFEALGIPD